MESLRQIKKHFHRSIYRSDCKYSSFIFSNLISLNPTKFFSNFFTRKCRSNIPESYSNPIILRNFKIFEVCFIFFLFPFSRLFVFFMYDFCQLGFQTSVYVLKNSLSFSLSIVVRTLLHYFLLLSMYVFVQLVFCLHNHVRIIFSTVQIPPIYIKRLCVTPMLSST